MRQAYGLTVIRALQLLTYTVMECVDAVINCGKMHSSKIRSLQLADSNNTSIQREGGMVK